MKYLSTTFNFDNVRLFMYSNISFFFVEVKESDDLYKRLKPSIFINDVDGLSSNYIFEVLYVLESFV